MTELSKSTMMTIVNLILAVLVVSSGYFLFVGMLNSIGEDKATGQLDKLRTELQNTCRKTEQAPNLEHIGDEFTLVMLAHYSIEYKEDPGEICGDTKCVCLLKDGSYRNCFSTKELGCHYKVDVKTPLYEGDLRLPPTPDASKVLKKLLSAEDYSDVIMPLKIIRGATKVPSFTCIYRVQVSWDKAGQRLLVDVKDHQLSKETLKIGDAGLAWILGQKLGEFQDDVCVTIA